MQPGEPTPWATGLTVSVVVAAIVVIALLSLAQGLAPAMWLGRATLIWRWVAYGTAAGIAATWSALLLSLLG
ncbi:MAG: DUF2537 domain-containing protein [Solirubrobacteraceae bacterium]